MKLSIKAGATSQSINFYVRDKTSTQGAGLTGLVFNTASLTAYYSFAGASATSTVITLATLAAVNSVYSSGGFKELDATNMPGWYRFDIPNAVLAASSGRSVAIHFQGGGNMAPLPIEIELTGWDNQDAIHGGMSALPNTAVTTNASLLTSGTSTDQLSVTSGKVLLQATQSGVTIPTVTTVTNQLTTAQIATGIWQDTTAGDFTTASSIGKSLYTSGVVPGGTGGLFIAGTNAATTVTTSFTTTFTGNLTGSVGSISGVSFPTNFSSLAISASGAAKIDGTSALVESYAAQGSGLTLSQSLYGLTQQLGAMSISGITMTVLKRDNSTTAKTYTLNSSTTPTSITEAT